jgi:L-ascorbate metabolism protein UlaG (beta-lactamase superfamily)
MAGPTDGAPPAIRGETTMIRISRRQALAFAATGLAGLGLAPLRPRAGWAQAGEGDAYPSADGDIVVHPVEHASLVLTVPGMVIYVDPVGGAEAYAGLPPADLILVTHEHGDHFDAGTLGALAGEARLLTNPAVHGMLPAELQARATAIANGESTTADAVEIVAIPAYNTTPDRLQYHPQGRDNGYVLTIGGTRVYVAGDTEDIPEMRALSGIDLAFVPMNLPYTMDVAQAADAVAAFAPGAVYPYHYGESSTAEFAALIGQSGAATEVVLRDWYPGA